MAAKKVKTKTKAPAKAKAKAKAKAPAKSALRNPRRGTKAKAPAKTKTKASAKTKAKAPAKAKTKAPAKKALRPRRVTKAPAKAKKTASRVKLSPYAAFAAAARKAAPFADTGDHAEVVAALRPYVRALPDNPPARGAGDEGVALGFAVLARSLAAIGQSDVAGAALEAAQAWSPRTRR